MPRGVPNKKIAEGIEDISPTSEAIDALMDDVDFDLAAYVTSHDPAVKEEVEPVDVSVVAQQALQSVSIDDIPRESIIGSKGAKYYFSSEHAIGMLRGLNCTIERERPDWIDLSDIPDKRMVAREQHANWKAKYTPAQQAVLNQAFRDNGSDMIRFVYERGPENASGKASTGYVWFATDSEAIAEVVRMHMRTGGDFQFIREISQNKYVQVGDMKFANDDKSKRLAVAYMEKTGQPMVPVARAS
jgi:hypothetical protein